MKFALVITVFSLCLASVQANDYLEYRDGDSVTYERINVLDGSRDELTMTVQNLYGNWMRLNGLFGQDAVYLHYDDDNNKVYIGDATSGASYLMLDFNDQQGQRYNFSGIRCVSSAKILNKGISQTIGDYNYSDLLLLQFERSCGGGVSYAWFAPNVGIVQWVVTPGEIGLNTFYYNLKSAAINGFSVPGEVSISTRFPSPLISVDNPNKDVLVEMSVFNQSYQDLKLVFDGTQEFEIELLDAERNVLNRWSQHNLMSSANASATTARIIESGTEFSFGGLIALRQVQVLRPIGEPPELIEQDLSAGRYFLRIYLMAERTPDANNYLRLDNELELQIR